jgi:paraquat-inducible protein B
VETSSFDAQKRSITYQLFINAPNDRLVTTNVRFWKDSGIAVDLSSSGMRVEMGSLATLFGGGVSFDIPEGLDMGEPVANKTGYHLFDDHRAFRIPSLPSILITSCSLKTRCADCSRGSGRVPWNPPGYRR